MEGSGSVARLFALRRSFGAAAARKKRLLLDAIERAEGLAPRDLLTLQDTLDLMRAYPDDPAVLKRVRRVCDGLRDRVAAVDEEAVADTGLPGSTIFHPFSYDVVKGLDRRFPGCLEIDWDALESDTVLAIVIELLLTPAEVEGLEDLKEFWPEWMARCRPASCRSDLQYVFRLLEGSTFTPMQRECLYEASALPVRYALDLPGTGLCEVEAPVARVHYQKKDMHRERFSLAKEIEKPLAPGRRVSAAEGRRLLDVALAALASRHLEILPLTGSNPRDVHLFLGPRGIQVLLAGVVPEQRPPLSSLYLFLVLKNGVPVAYGPAVPFLGCCELGINLFPEFRGFEIRTIYAQVMRVLHHVVGADLFYLTKYAMGVDNEDALRTGAFWFYRKLGFVPSNPEVEALAREEEARMKADPSYRSDRRMLRRLSRTEAWLDLSDGRCRPFDFAHLSVVMSEWLSERFGADRARAVPACRKQAVRDLGIRGLRTWSDAERASLDGLAPVLALMGDVGSWSTGEKAAMARVVRGKAGRSEIEAGLRLKRHPRFEASLRQAVAETPISRAPRGGERSPP